MRSPLHLDRDLRDPGELRWRRYRQPSSRDGRPFTRTQRRAPGQSKDRIFARKRIRLGLPDRLERTRTL